MTRSSLNAVRCIALLGCGWAASGMLAAQTLDTLDQSLWLRLGAFRPSIDTNIRVDSAGGNIVGSQFSLEDLGLARHKTLPTFLVGARIGSAWRAEFEAFRLSRSGVDTLDAQLVVEDTTYSASARVDTRLVSDVFRLSAGYSFLKTPQAELGVVAGLHITRFDFELVGVGSVAGQPASRTSEVRQETVPLPTVGMYGAWAFAPNWQATGRADYFSLAHRGIDGRLINAQANVLYRFSRQLALGLGWRYDDYRVEASRSSFSGLVDYRFRGPQAILEAGF